MNGSNVWGSLAPFGEWWRPPLVQIEYLAIRKVTSFMKFRTIAVQVMK